MGKMAEMLRYGSLKAREATMSPERFASDERLRVAREAADWEAEKRAKGYDNAGMADWTRKEHERVQQEHNVKYGTNKR